MHDTEISCDYDFNPASAVYILPQKQGNSSSNYVYILSATNLPASELKMQFLKQNTP